MYINPSQISRRLDWLLPKWLENAAAYDQSVDEGLLTIFYTLLVNSVILLVCILIFSFYRIYDIKIFSPKCDLMPGKAPPRLSTSTLFGWMKELYNISDEVIIEKGGYDILFFIRFYRLAFKVFFWFGIYAWGILLPINATGGDTDGNSYNMWSMTNLKQESDRCWAHLIGIYLLTGITIYFIEKEFLVYAKYRHLYLRQRHAHLRTVLVEGIPHKMRSTVTLTTYFETLYPGCVLSVRLGQNIRYLDRLVERRIQILTLLERVMYQNHTGSQRATIRFNDMAKNIDAYTYYNDTLTELNTEIGKEHDLCLSRAMYTENINNVDKLSLIESFLYVTEIGSLKKKYKKDKLKKRDSIKNFENINKNFESLKINDVNKIEFKNEGIRYEGYDSDKVSLGTYKSYQTAEGVYICIYVCVYIDI